MNFEVPAAQYRFIALDVETANGASWSISQIGIACVTKDNQIEVHSTLVDPRTTFNAFNIRLTGIHPDHVLGAPVFGEVLSALKPVLSQHVIIQHSSFDAGAIASACDRDGIEPPDWEWLDSVKIARRAWPEFTGQGGHGLAHLKERLNLSFDHHDAGEDAKAAAMVVLQAEQRMGVDFRLIPPTGRKSRKTMPRVPANPDGHLVGAVVAFSGRLTISRQKAAELAAAAGMRVSDRLGHHTTHLVVGGPDMPLFGGARPSAKHRQALDMHSAGHPIAILDEAGFRALLRPESTPESTPSAEPVLRGSS